MHRVTLTTADGAAFAATLPDALDFVLVDYGVPSFAPALPIVRDKMAPGCLLFVDGGPDGYWDSAPVRGFCTRLESDPLLLASRLRLHKEHLVAVRLPGATSEQCDPAK